MAGLGECCSHVASLLWAVEAGARVGDSMTVTQKKAYWVVSNGVKDIPYAPLKSIGFIGKKNSTTAIQTSIRIAFISSLTISFWYLRIF